MNLASKRMIFVLLLFGALVVGLLAGSASVNSRHLLNPDGGVRYSERLDMDLVLGGVHAIYRIEKVEAGRPRTVVSATFPAVVSTGRISEILYLADYPGDGHRTLDAGLVEAIRGFQVGDELSFFEYGRWQENSTDQTPLAVFDFGDEVSPNEIYTVALTYLDVGRWPDLPTPWMLYVALEDPSDNGRLMMPLVGAEAWDAVVAMVRAEEPGLTGDDILARWASEWDELRAQGVHTIGLDARLTSDPGTMSALHANWLAGSGIPAVDAWHSIPVERRGLDPAVVPANLHDTLLTRQIVVRIEDPSDLPPQAGVVVTTPSGVAYAASVIAGSHPGQLHAFAGEPLTVAVVGDVDRMEGVVEIASVDPARLPTETSTLYVEFRAGGISAALAGLARSYVVGVAPGGHVHELSEWTTVDEWRVSEPASAELGEIVRRYDIPEGFVTPDFVEVVASG